MGRAFSDPRLSTINFRLKKRREIFKYIYIYIYTVASGSPKPPFVPYKTQHRPQKGSQTSNLDLHNPQLGPQKTPTWLQKAPFKVPNPIAQAWRNGGVASLNIYIYIYIYSLGLWHDCKQKVASLNVHKSC